MSFRNIIIALSVLCSILSGASSAPSSDITNTKCSIEHVSHWPEDIASPDLAWRRNENDERNGPIYRLFTEVDVRSVVSEKEYQMTLTSLADGTHLKRFLIWAESEEDHCSYGMLRSKSDESEHMSYRCPRYLVERSIDFDGSDEIQFSWQAPNCGCTTISVQVMNGDGEVFAQGDDPYNALHLRACIKGSNSMLADQPRPAVKRNKKSRKQVIRAKGKVHCCKKGIAAFKESKDTGICAAAPDNLTAEEALTNFKLALHKCSEVFSACCKDKNRLKKFKNQVSKAKGEFKKHDGNLIA